MSEAALKLKPNESANPESATPGLAANDSALPKLTGPWPLAILISASVVILGFSFYWFSYLEKFVSTDDAYIEADLFPVSTKVAGSVREVLVREGQSVKKGELLLTIDESDFVFERNFKKLKVEKARLDFHRSETLHGAKSISDFDFENANAGLKAAEVDLEGTEIKINYTKILSPVDGIVAKRAAQMGQIISPGQSLFIVVSDSEKWIRANFKETQIENLHVGQTVDIEVDGYPHHPLTGTIDTIFPSSGAKLSILPAENSTGNFTRVVQRIPVKINIDAASLAQLSLKPGMSAQVKVDTREKRQP